MSNAWFVNPQTALAVLKVAELLHEAIDSNFSPFPIISKIRYSRLITSIAKCDAKTCAKIFLYTLEGLNRHGLEVTSLPLDLIKHIYKSGGIGPVYGNNMEGWV
jgi:hypothetical protein